MAKGNGVQIYLNEKEVEAVMKWLDYLNAGPTSSADAEVIRGVAQKIRNKLRSRFTMRPLYKIAEEIRKEWKTPYFGSVPYLEAMSQMSSIQENYGCDDGKSIVLYFLANAQAWRGEAARRIKAELKEACK